MVSRRKSLKIFPGWWIVLTGGLLSLWGYGYQGYGFSALFKPIATELSFTRAMTSIPASVGRFEGGFEAPIAGWVTDKFGPRWIMFFGILVISLALISMYFVNSFWSFLVVWGIMLGTGINISLSIPLDKAIANWFVRKRGLAAGIKMVGAGLSGVLVLPLITWLVTLYGWRLTCVTGGLVMAVVGLPLTWFFIKEHRPEHYGLLPDGATAETTRADEMIERGVKYASESEEVEFTLRQAMKTPAYWLFIIVFSSMMLAGPAINIHGVPFLTDMGISPVRAASMMAIMLAASLPARILGGFLADRVRKNQLRFLMLASLLLQATGFAIFLMNKTMVTVYIWFIIYGFGMGAGYALMAPIRARYFGRKAFGVIGGSSTLFMMPAGVVAPIYLGWAYDTTGSYITAFTVLTVLLAGATALSFFFLPPKPPAQISDIRHFM
ncbi:MAG: MFS transporter [Chloroflexota bacterium]